MSFPATLGSALKKEGGCGRCYDEDKHNLSKNKRQSGELTPRSPNFNGAATIPRRYLIFIYKRAAGVRSAGRFIGRSLGRRPHRRLRAGGLRRGSAPAAPPVCGRCPIRESRAGGNRLRRTFSAGAQDSVRSVPRGRVRGSGTDRTAPYCTVRRSTVAGSMQRSASATMRP